MWASGLKGADGTIANVVEYQADGKVKGTGNTTFISDGTPPMTEMYTESTHNRVVHSSDYVAYGGGTRTNVAYIKQVGLGNEERSLYISGTGRAQRYIGWSDTPANAPWYLDPWAWAQGRALNAGENPQPKKIVSESKSATEQGSASTNPGSSSSDTSNTVSPSASLSGLSSASAGESVTVDVSTTTPYSSVWWYVAGPGESGLGTHVETDTGGSSSTTDSLTYTFGSSNSGDYTIAAYITNYSDQSVYQESHTVSVSGSSISYTPPSAPTPSLPTTILCRVASSTGCTIRSSDGRACLVSTCSSGCGNPYWTCYPNAIYDHETTFTSRRCGTSFTRCSNGTCTTATGTYDYHWAQ